MSGVSMSGRTGDGGVNAVDQHIGYRLMLARDQIGARSEEVAGQLGVTNDEYVAIEAGQLRLSAADMQVVSLFLRIEVSWFFEGLTDAVLKDFGDDRVQSAEIISFAKARSRRCP